MFYIRQEMKAQEVRWRHWCGKKTETTLEKDSYCSIDSPFLIKASESSVTKGYVLQLKEQRKGNEIYFISYGVLE